MALIRSIIHMLWMGHHRGALHPGHRAGFVVRDARHVAVPHCPRLAVALCDSARPLLGIQYRVTGMEHLPQGEKSGAVLLVQAPVHVRDVF